MPVGFVNVPGKFAASQRQRRIGVKQLEHGVRNIDDSTNFDRQLSNDFGSVKTDFSQSENLCLASNI
ncbi:hypothetical protein NQ315_007843 [Exocentrus adspersus]|uniref:Uncharacterized protein n=1 Tax=Exocentrus adspersus TaxID=1586481 RepID=A0AAV8W838_9CUCU|nr:hypothetical protein NQ315_007843 [Exocentrus adspersus]